MVYEIIKYGHPMLREKGAIVDPVDDDVRRLARDMLETMYGVSGAGLAAQQIGKAILLCVVDVPPELDMDEEGNPLNPGVEFPLVLINPEILQSDGSQVGQEGCLSFPEITLDVKRAMDTTVRYVRTDGTEATLQCRGFLSRAIQHELDHLAGVLFIDRVSQLKRLAIAGQLKRLKKSTRKELKARG